MISSISIRNFRSISAAEIPADWITTLVGSNDAGKSNVLRAINLFFNGETNPGESFDFSRDFNQFAVVRQRTAPQIEIKIVFKLPDGYLREDAPAEVEWRKVWRFDGEAKRMETRTFIDGTDFPPRSKIPALMDRIRFTYVPAIKDKAFFADLQGRLYDVLSSVAEEPLKESAGAFQTQLGEQLHDLLDTLRTAFGAEAAMRLPENLRQIFENLEINSGEVPLSRRGDGIKIRHIPMILKFIAVKRDELLTRGGVRYTHIWGFEEPENNVEMSSAFRMASDFVDLVAEASHFQLFFTTHSPIFYRLDQHRPEAAEWLVSHFVSKDGKNTCIETRTPDQVDESMGLMPIVAPYVAQAKARYDELREQLEQVRDIATQKRPTVFVEGESDRKVITKAWETFSEFPVDTINICAGDGAFGSANALESRALAWLLTLRHRPTQERAKAAAIFDTDASGRRAHKSLTEEITRLNLHTYGLKAISLRTPLRLRNLARQGFQLSIDLEAFYTDALWQRAESRKWLEPVKDLGALLSTTLVGAMAAGGPNPFEGLEPNDALRLKFKFSDTGKQKAAQHLARMTQTEAERELAEFRQLIIELQGHFNLQRPESQTAQ
ncbi:ATP-dependent nuclease [Azospirillum palustre]|uniref:ATP-dependent nuclease n=1 Tax=Azospirillum palustre TaxID=2044885 RepID=UPI001178BAA9|nr:AAA family ATPase [Azospirillum palustre]